MHANGHADTFGTGVMVDRARAELQAPNTSAPSPPLDTTRLQV
jgi:hypothetical protein